MARINLAVGEFGVLLTLRYSSVAAAILEMTVAKSANAEISVAYFQSNIIEITVVKNNVLLNFFILTFDGACVIITVSEDVRGLSPPLVTT